MGPASWSMHKGHVRLPQPMQSSQSPATQGELSFVLVVVSTNEPRSNRKRATQIRFGWSPAQQRGAAAAAIPVASLSPSAPFAATLTFASAWHSRPDFNDMTVIESRPVALEAMRRWLILTGHDLHPHQYVPVEVIGEEMQAAQPAVPIVDKQPRVLIRDQEAKEAGLLGIKAILQRSQKPDKRGAISEAVGDAALARAQTAALDDLLWLIHALEPLRLRSCLCLQGICVLAAAFSWWTSLRPGKDWSPRSLVRPWRRLGLRAHHRREVQWHEDAGNGARRTQLRCGGVGV